MLNQKKSKMNEIRMIECTVCYAEKETTQFELLLCGHRFCTDCMKQFSGFECAQTYCHECHFLSKCPICRQITDFTIGELVQGDTLCPFTSSASTASSASSGGENSMPQLLEMIQRSLHNMQFPADEVTFTARRFGTSWWVSTSFTSPSQLIEEDRWSVSSEDSH